MPQHLHVKLNFWTKSCLNQRSFAYQTRSQGWFVTFSPTQKESMPSLTPQSDTTPWRSSVNFSKPLPWCSMLVFNQLHPSHSLNHQIVFSQLLLSYFMNYLQLTSLILTSTWHLAKLIGPQLDTTSDHPPDILQLTSLIWHCPKHCYHLATSRSSHRTPLIKLKCAHCLFCSSHPRLYYLYGS